MLELVKIFPEQPLFNKVIITLNLDKADGGLVLSDNSLSDIQYVVAKGPNVSKEVTTGALVRIDLEKLSVQVPVDGNSHETVSQIKIDPIFFNGSMYALIEDRIIKTTIK